MLIDIVIGQLAEKGGLDRVINMLTRYGEDKNHHFRIVQLVNTEVAWYDNTMDVINLKTVDDNPTFRDSVNDYATFLMNSPQPNVILATGWPIVSLICREALKSLEANYNTVLNIPICCWPHMTFKEAEKCGVGNLSCVDSADFVFCISKEISDEVKRYNSNCKLELVYNPVEITHIIQRSYNPNKLCYVGRLVDYKRIDLIFHAMSLCKNTFEIIIVGAGEEEKALTYANDYGIINSVKFVGYSEHPWDDVDDASIFLMASDYEGFGLTIVEAMANGLTVVSTPVGIAPEIIIPGQTGYLTEISSAKMLSQILDYISEGMLPLIPSEQVKDIVGKFNPVQYANKFIHLLDALEIELSCK